jgi:ribokinase
LEAESRRAARIAVIGSYAIALVMDVDRLPHEGETLLASNFRQTYGGKGSDMAVQAARLGAEVHFIGRVGDDDFGREFASLLAREQIHAEHLYVTSGRSTGAGFIIKNPFGANMITVDMGANQLLDERDLLAAEATIATCDVMLIQLEILRGTALAAAALGRRHGLQVILNPAPAQDFSAVDLSAVDILTPNETEARVCLGLAASDPAPDEEIGRRLLALGPGAVVLTLGARGALLVLPEGARQLPSPLVETLDTTGAGDAFNAGLAVALSEGADLPTAVRFANFTAALSTTRRETVPSYHTRAAVEDLLAAVAVAAATPDRGGYTGEARTNPAP